MARTPSASADSSRETADLQMAARLGLEEHWAVSALPISDRERARALAKRAWKRGSPRLHGAWAPRDAELMARVADAYDIAALEQVDQVARVMRDLDRAGVAPVLPFPPADVTRPALLGDDTPGYESRRAVVGALNRATLDGLARALNALRGASDVAFTFARVRPVPATLDPAHLAHVLRVLSLGALANDVDALRQWVAAALDARVAQGIAPITDDAGDADDADYADYADRVGAPDLSASAVLRWDAHLRDRLVEIWLDIADVVLTSGSTNGRTDAGDVSDERATIERAFRTLARLREQRAERETELLVGLPSSTVPQMRAHLQVLYYLADATAHVVVWARRGVTALAATSARLALESASTLAAGDRQLDTAFQWLAMAIDVPMIVAGLPAPVGTYAEPGGGASAGVEAHVHRPPARRRAE